MSVISVFFLGCATERGTVKDLTLSMVLLNQGQPFVSREFAELIDPKDSLPRVGKKIVPKYLTITIRKENCEIVSVS